MLDRRPDGWPLCPCCEEDELADLEHAEADPNGNLFCYRCGRVTVRGGAPWPTSNVIPFRRATRAAERLEAPGEGCAVAPSPFDRCEGLVHVFPDLPGRCLCGENEWDGSSEIPPGIAIYGSAGVEATPDPHGETIRRGTLR